jgi:hypothetical protein
MKLYVIRLPYVNDPPYAEYSKRRSSRLSRRGRTVRFLGSEEVPEVDLRSKDSIVDLQNSL